MAGTHICPRHSGFLVKGLSSPRLVGTMGILVPSSSHYFRVVCNSTGINLLTLLLCQSPHMAHPSPVECKASFTVNSPCLCTVHNLCCLFLLGCWPLCWVEPSLHRCFVTLSKCSLALYCMYCIAHCCVVVTCSTSLGDHSHGIPPLLTLCMHWIFHLSGLLVCLSKERLLLILCSTSLSKHTLDCF